MTKSSLFALAIALISLSSVYGNMTSVSWGAQVSNGVGTASGTPLPNGSGDLILLGSFNLTNAQIAANGANESFLMSNFVQFGSTTIGNANPNGPGSASDGYWTGNSTNSTSTLGIAGKEVYYWVFNSPSANLASQYGIYTKPSNNSWIFPDDTATAATLTDDLSQVPHDSSGILFGSYGTGLSRDNTSPLYNLAAVPEPGTWAAAALVASSLGAHYLRRRRAAR